MLEHIGHQFISCACRTSAFQRGRAPKFHHRRLKLLSTFWWLAHGSRAERLPSAMCLHRLLEMALGSQRALQISGQISLSYSFLLRQQSSIVRMRKNDWTSPTASLYVTSCLIATYCAVRIHKCRHICQTTQDFCVEYILSFGLRAAVWILRLFM
jgi:hypothetical protein